MKNDEHFGERGLAPSVLANIRIANERIIFRTEKTISKQNSRIEVWRERNLAKAPPGYSVNLEGPRGHPPEEVTTPDRVLNPVGAKCQLFTILYNEKNMVINKKLQFKIFTNVSNFYKMKKQILLFVLFVVALVTGINESWGQINSDPKVSAAPTCGGTATSPVVGVQYGYKVTVPNAGGYTGAGTFTWKVTDNVDLLAASTVAATDFTGVGTGDTYSVTWNASSIGKTYYVVVNYTETNPTGGTCSSENIKVFEVQPMNGFWLAINASTDGTTAGIITNNGTDKINICSPAITKATISKTGDPATAEVTYEYGVTKLYANIHAGGLSGDFEAKITISGLVTNQSATIAGWTAQGTPDAMGNGSYTKTLTSVASGADFSLELDITNKQFEGKADLPVKIIVDGTYTSGGTTYKDKYDGASNCMDQPDDADNVTYTIKARPTVTPSNPASFVTPNPTLN